MASDYIEFKWPTKEVQLSHASSAPLLTIYIPTYNRPIELMQCVESIAEQIKDSLEIMVEIIISDNGSSSDGIKTIRELADRYSFISIYLNAENGGGRAQIAVSPWRARGKWLWVFGDDDLLLPGGVKRVLDIITSDAPVFISLNRIV